MNVFSFKIVPKQKRICICDRNLTATLIFNSPDFVPVGFIKFLILIIFHSVDSEKRYESDVVTDFSRDV